MVRVVKFVVTSFCAGRRVSVFQSQWIFAVKVFSVQGPAARKPYNPILGEFFECSFRADTSRLTVEQPVEGGPQAKPGDQSVLDVTFVSEQVSHHPPSELTCSHLHRLRLLFLGHSFIFLCFTSDPAWKSMLERGKNVIQKRSCPYPGQCLQIRESANVSQKISLFFPTLHWIAFWNEHYMSGLLWPTGWHEIYDRSCCDLLTVELFSSLGVLCWMSQ